MNILDPFALFSSFHEYFFHNFIDQQGIPMDSGDLLGIMSVCLVLSRHYYLVIIGSLKYLFSHTYKKNMLPNIKQAIQKMFPFFHHINLNISRKKIPTLPAFNPSSDFDLGIQ